MYEIGEPFEIRRHKLSPAVDDNGRLPCPRAQQCGYLAELGQRHHEHQYVAAFDTFDERARA
jgi:hypothetical protein